MENWHWERFFSKYFDFSLSVSFAIAPYTSPSTRCSYQKEKWVKPGNLPKGNAVSEVREHWVEKRPSLFCP